MAMIAGAIVFALVIRFYGYGNTFRLWNISTYHGSFFDLRLIPGAAESYRRGYDPAVSDPGDPTSRIFNYPKVWYLLFPLGINQSWTIPAGIAIIVLFLASVYFFPGKLTGLSTFFMLLALGSSEIMLAFARVNVDMFFFVAMTLSLLLVDKSAISSFVIFLVAILFRITPVLGVGFYMDREGNRSLKYIFGAILFILLYFLLTLGDMKFIFNNTQKGYDSAYGLSVLPYFFKEVVDVQEVRDGPYFFYRMASILNTMFVRFPYIPYIIAVFLLIFISYLGIKRRNRFEADDLQNLRAFWMGAGMYIGTFFIGNNWDYRLIFLLFTLPQLSDWVTQKDPVTKIMAAFTLFVLFWSLWYLGIQALMTHTIFFGEYINVLLDETANWALFAALIYFFAFSLPDWIFQNLQSLFEKVMPVRRESAEIK